MKKLRSALAEALIPESPSVIPLVPNPFAYDELSKKWSINENCEDKPNYQQIKEHYETNDKKPQLLNSIFGLSKAKRLSSANASNSSSSSSSSNDPQHYQVISENEILMKNNRELQEQVQHRELMLANEKLLERLNELASTSEKRPRSVKSSDRDQSDNEYETERHNHHRPKKRKKRDKSERSSHRDRYHSEDENDDKCRSSKKKKREKSKRSNYCPDNDNDNDILSSNDLIAAQQSLNDID